MPSKTCTRCTAAISADVADGLCPACLLESALEGGGTDTAASFPQAFGDYDLLEELARGGQGVVYRARHRALPREVALKMFPAHPWTTDAERERFRSEARIAAELDHPAIVPLYDTGEVSGQPYFTMKLIDGVGLDRLPAGEIPSRRAAEIVAEMARAVHHAHERGVLHRDIKPGNVLLDAAGRPHLSDFGIAKLLTGDSGLTRTREWLGTPSYLSPEAAAGDPKKISPATDVYGLGAVLYYLLAARPPFEASSPVEAIRLVAEAEPLAPRRVNPQADRDLEAICLKCMEKDPSRRYASAAALADDLERWLHHQPIHARPITVGYRAEKWLRRNALTAAAVVGFAVVFVVMGGMIRRSRAGAAPHALAVVLRAGDADSRYLATEFSRNLVHLFGRVPGAGVAPRSDVLKWETSAEPPAKMASAIPAARLLFGTLRQSGERVHVQAALWAPGAAAPLWTKEYDVALSGSAAVQAQMVRATAAQLGLALPNGGGLDLRAPLTSDAEAWAYYLHGRQLVDTQSETALLQAVDEFGRAIGRDPDFAQAYAALADAHLDLGYTFREPATHFAQAHRFVREALRRDDTLADALIADGVLRYFLDWDWSSAEGKVKQALLLDSSRLETHGCYLHCLETVGRIDDALATVRAAAAANPNSIMIQAELGCSSYYAGRFDEALRYCRETLAKDPDNAYLRWSLARTLAQLGQFAEAARELESAMVKPGGDWMAIVAELAYVRAGEQRRDDALRLIEELWVRGTREFIDPYMPAMAFAGLGDADGVFRELQRAVSVHSSWLPSLPIDPKFAPWRGDARFRALLQTLKIPAR